MINGFLLDIVNENKDEVHVSLFQNQQLPIGVSINAKNSSYDYKSLLLMSINEGFIGSGISIDDDHNHKVTICKNGNTQSYEFYKILYNKEIIIDGLANYITLVIRPSSNLSIQLIPAL
jgi:hypothetical protein